MALTASPFVTHRSVVNAWECDQMEHMNVQFYGDRFSAAEVHLFASLGLSPRLLAEHRWALRPMIDRIQFKRELRTGAGLLVDSAVVGRAQAAVRAFHRLRHSEGGGDAATLDCVYRLIDRDTGSMLAPPDAVTGRIDGARLEPASFGLPDDAESSWGSAGVSLARADALGLVETYRGVVRETDCLDGSISRRSLIHRMSDAAGHLGIYDARNDEAWAGKRVGSAAVDYRLDYLRPVPPGTLIALRSGFTGFEEKTLRFGHWLIDCETGEALARMAVIALFFDLDARKALPLPANLRTRLQTMLVPEVNTV